MEQSKTKSNPSFLGRSAPQDRQEKEHDRIQRECLRSVGTKQWKFDSKTDDAHL